MELCKETVHDIILADSAVFAMKHLRHPVQKWILENYGSFLAAVRELGLEQVIKERRSKPRDTHVWIAQTLRLALEAGITSVSQLRRHKGLADLPDLRDKTGGQCDGCPELGAADLSLLARRIYVEYGTFDEAVDATGNRELFMEVKAAKSKINLRAKRVRFRALLEGIASSGNRISIAHLDSPVRASYIALYRLGAEGRKAILSELRRIWRQYGSQAYDPKVLPTKLTTEGAQKLAGMLVEVVQEWDKDFPVNQPSA